MLEESCPNEKCTVPLMRDPGTGFMHCVSCSTIYLTPDQYEKAQKQGHNIVLADAPSPTPASASTATTTPTAASTTLPTSTSTTSAAATATPTPAPTKQEAPLSVPTASLREKEKKHETKHGDVPPPEKRSKAGASSFSFSGTAAAGTDTEERKKRKNEEEVEQLLNKEPAIYSQAVAVGLKRLAEASAQLTETSSWERVHALVKFIICACSSLSTMLSIGLPGKKKDAKLESIVKGGVAMMLYHINRGSDELATSHDWTINAQIIATMSECTQAVVVLKRLLQS
jgi:hypothetical protein